MSMKIQVSTIVHMFYVKNYTLILDMMLQEVCSAVYSDTVPAKRVTVTDPIISRWVLSGAVGICHTRDTTEHCGFHYKWKL